MAKRRKGPGAPSEVLKLTGELTIRQAAELREALLAALGSRDRVIVDLSETTQTDVAGLQLFCAAHREAAARGKTFAIADKPAAAAAFLAAVDAAGFRRRRGCAEGCLWGEVSHG